MKELMSLNKYYEFVMGNRKVEYKIVFKPLSPTSVLHKWVGAQYIDDCIYGIPNDMNAFLKHTDQGDSYLGEVGDGLFKWTGGCIWKRFLYAFPRTSNSLLKMSLDTENIEYIMLEDKYLKEHHYGGICTKEGLIYQPPRDSDHILVWDLERKRTKKIYLNSTGTGLRYCGSVLHPNGHVYFLPETGNKVIKLNTKTEEWSFIGDDIDAMVFDAKIAVDGNIYGYSAYCPGILKICVGIDSVEMIKCQIRPGAYGTKLGINGHLYSIPGDGYDVWDFDPITYSIKSIYRLSNRINAKYAGGVSDRKGDIYGVPAKASDLFCLTSNVSDVQIPKEIFWDFFSDCY